MPEAFELRKLRELIYYRNNQFTLKYSLLLNGFPIDYAFSTSDDLHQR